MKLLELFDREKKAKYERGLKKSRSLRSIKDRQFKQHNRAEKSAFEIQG